jgi:3-isopropylmalate/(R)-2-methylmalate dehydratase small subunit
MMEKFTKLEAVAAPMLRDNIDTDAIIPVAQMKVLAGDFGKSLFFNLRYRPDGSENPDFVLNRPEYRSARILVAANNFACGSSREHAVWALLGFGIRCVIAESFGDIFYNNSFRMGLLPVVLPREQVQALGEAVTAAAGTRNVVVDLQAQTITGPDAIVYAFEIDANRRRILLEGLDGVGVTLLRADDIAAFQARDRVDRPWVYDIGLTDGTPAPARVAAAR